MPLWYILSIRNSTFDNAVEAANYSYETGYFEDIDPAFMFNFEANCTDDPLFGQMWGLKNTANPGIDINICNAWTITKGAGIKVAVVDQGIYRSHMDLAANIHPLSFDAQSGMSPSVFTGESHGTHVAGTIAAVKNELQVVGVAPESKLIGVSHDLYVTATMSAELASGINWAWQDGVGADITNCSFGDQGSYFYDEFHSTALEKAISNAMSQETGQLALQETGKNFCADFQINMSAIPNGLYLVSTDFSTMVN